MVEGYETQEAFLARSNAFVQFYAAFLQSDEQKQHGMEHVWSYLSRQGLSYLRVCVVHVDPIACASFRIEMA